MYSREGQNVCKTTTAMIYEGITVELNMRPFDGVGGTYRHMDQELNASSTGG